MDLLYYDGHCPVCRREMKLLSRLKDDQLALVDIHGLTVDDGDRPDAESLLRLLHLRAGDGTWLTGVEASVRAWRHTRLGGIWAPLLWPPFRVLVERVYQRWASRRFEKLYGRCAIK